MTVPCEGGLTDSDRSLRESGSGRRVEWPWALAEWLMIWRDREQMSNVQQRNPLRKSRYQAKAQRRKYS